MLCFEAKDYLTDSVYLFAYYIAVTKMCLLFFFGALLLIINILALFYYFDIQVYKCDLSVRLKGVKLCFLQKS